MMKLLISLALIELIAIVRGMHSVTLSAPFHRPAVPVRRFPLRGQPYLRTVNRQSTRGNSNSLLPDKPTYAQVAHQDPEGVPLHYDKASKWITAKEKFQETVQILRDRLNDPLESSDKIIEALRAMQAAHVELEKWYHREFGRLAKLQTIAYLRPPRRVTIETLKTRREWADQELAQLIKAQTFLRDQLLQSELAVWGKLAPASNLPPVDPMDRVGLLLRSRTLALRQFEGLKKLGVSVWTLESASKRLIEACYAFDHGVYHTVRRDLKNSAFFVGFPVYYDFLASSQ